MKNLLQELAFKAGVYLTPAARPKLRREYYKRFKGVHPYAFMCSYPRSGNTWTRLIIAGLLDPNCDCSDLDTIDRLVPDNRQEVFARVQPLVVKEHAPSFNMFNRVIYNVRDPRDVMVSAYHYACSALNYPHGFDRYFLGFFIDRTAHPFGLWHEHVRQALEWQKILPKRFHLIRYEDIHEDPFSETWKLANFLGIKTDAKAIQSIIERTAFSRVQKVNQNNRDPRKNSTVRSGKVGSWIDFLSQKQIFNLEMLFKREMDELGYEATILKSDSSS